jgi:hypothetical protein
MSPSDATTMAGLLGGPAVIGVAALVGYVRGVLGKADREPKAGWLSLLVCGMLAGWFVVFLLLSTGGVLRSWAANGHVRTEFVALTAAWLVGIGMLVWSLVMTRSLTRYLSASYRVGERPAALRVLRRLLRVST